MQFSTLFTSVLLAGSALATSHKSSGQASAAANGTAATGTSTTGQETVHVVQVGQGGNLSFSPSNIKANVGDLVQFQFWPKNHSVVQSTFAQPCVPMANVMTNATNTFFSGFMPTNRSASGTGSNTLTYTIRVTSTAPIWYYCSQAKHCQGGMVGAINAAETGEKTVAAFAALAAQAKENLSPGQVAGAGGAAAGGNTTTPTTGGNGTTGGSTTLATATASADANGAAGGAGGAAAGGAGATASSSGQAAQQTTNAAPGNALDSAKTGMVGIVGAAVAFMFL